jgi:hypothetical protein
VYHGGTENNLGFLTQKSFVPFCGILEPLAVSVFLGTDGYVLQYLTVEHVYLLVAYQEVVEVIIGDGIDLGVLQSFHNEAAGLLLEEAFNAEDNAAFEAEVLGYVFVVLIIILPYHSLLYEIEVTAYLTFL